MSIARAEASEKMLQQQRAAEKRFDKRRKVPTSYKIGDLVRIEKTLIDKTTLGKSKKLVAKFQGPYRIMKILPDDRFLIEDTPITRKGSKRYENVIAIDKLHPWLNFNDPASDDSNNDSDSEREKKQIRPIRNNVRILTKINSFTTRR